MSFHTPTLHTTRLLLRPFTEADMDAIYTLMSNAQVLRYWDDPPWNDRSQAERFIANCKKMEQERSGVRLALERSSDGAFIGWYSLMKWDPDSRSAMIGYCLTEKAWGQGFATEAAGAVLQWAFDTLDLNRVQSGADTRNRASERVLEKLGFLHEGVRRESCIVNGEVSDDSVYGLLRREWNRLDVKKILFRNFLDTYKARKQKTNLPTKEHALKTVRATLSKSKYCFVIAQGENAWSSARLVQPIIDNDDFVI